VYLRGRPSVSGSVLAWMDRSGETTPILNGPGVYTSLRLAPGGNRLVVAEGFKFLIHDLERATTTALPLSTSVNQWPAWAPDARHIVYSGRNSSKFGIWWARTDGAGEPQLLLASSHFVAPSSVSSDGKAIAFHEWYADTGWDISILPLDISDP